VYFVSIVVATGWVKGKSLRVLLALTAEKAAEWLGCVTIDPCRIVLSLKTSEVAIVNASVKWLIFKSYVNIHQY
tara:strand:- start:368 stop:589 length:222 start_codon:yes stop_codon:yes gene_type:complete